MRLCFIWCQSGLSVMSSKLIWISQVQHDLSIFTSQICTKTKFLTLTNDNISRCLMIELWSTKDSWKYFEQEQHSSRMRTNCYSDLLHSGGGVPTHFPDTLPPPGYPSPQIPTLGYPTPWISYPPGYPAHLDTLPWIPYPPYTLPKKEPWTSDTLAPWTEWQMPVKTLPSLSFCEKGQWNINL